MKQFGQAACLLASLMLAECARSATLHPAGETTLRIALSSGRTSLSAPEVGLAQIRQNLSLEQLAIFGDDGRPRPLVAEAWTVSEDRRTLQIRLRANVKYQDGTPVKSDDIASILQRTLPRSMGPAFADVEKIEATDQRAVEIRFHRPSGFQLDVLETAIQKPGTPSMGTGPYSPIPGVNNELKANANYYLGKPSIDRIVIKSYPSLRSAWADMLRNQNDMLYDVGADAMDSMRKATNVAQLFTYLKRYQYLIVLNSERPALGSPAVRQALNLAVDRDGLVQDALSGQGQPSAGPVPSAFWAAARSKPSRISYDPQRAAALIGQGRPPVRFTCLVVPDYERLALVVKKQLEAIGVDMAVEEVSIDQLFARLGKRDFDAFLVDAVSGPTMFRLYRFWHSGVKLNPTDLGNRSLDGALDKVRDAVTDEDYRRAVEAVQEAALEDPPAIFLAWSEGARAVSTRFDVPEGAGQRDPFSSVRLWRPANVQTAASRN